MINVLICGINNEKAQCVYNLTNSNPNINVVCGIDNNPTMLSNIDCTVYSAFDDVCEAVDMVIDFSAQKMIDEVLEFCINNKCALIECYVGYNAEQKQKIKEASKIIPIFMSQYFSLGVDLMFKLCATASNALKGYDIEIIEKYYSYKKDAPGAITIGLAEEINEIFGGERKIVIGRSSKRHGNEICIHCVRGGNVLGEHEILFIGPREVITIRHETLDKTLYAESAISILEFMQDKTNGYYTMRDYFHNS